MNNQIEVYMREFTYSKKGVLFSQGFGGCYAICIYKKLFIKYKGFFSHLEPLTIDYLEPKLKTMKEKFSKGNNFKAIVLIDTSYKIIHLSKSFKKLKTYLEK